MADMGVYGDRFAGKECELSAEVLNKKKLESKKKAQNNIYEQWT